MGVVCGITDGLIFGGGLGLLALIFVGISSGKAAGRSSGYDAAISINIFVKVTVAIFLSLSGGILMGIAPTSNFDIALSLVVGFTIGISSAIATRLLAFSVKGSSQMTVTGAILSIFLLITLGMAGLVVIIMIGAGITSRNFTTGFFGSIGYILGTFRIYYYPIHLAYVWRKALISSYPCHPVVWDDMCVIPFFGLNRTLLRLAEETNQGEMEIERLISGYPSQRSQALLAKTLVIARKAGFVSNLSKLDEILAPLPEGEKGYLRQNKDVRGQASKICHLQVRLDTINIPFFREQAAELLCKEIENFCHRIAGASDPSLREFQVTASKWLKIAENQLADIRKITSKEPTYQLFRAGDPVDRDQEAFVSRISIIGELEQQIMSGNGCPGLVLYGRRRTGKSTVLRNLNGFLPTDVTTISISMQSPEFFSTRKAFIRSLVGEIQKQLLNPRDGELNNVAKSAGSVRSLFNFLDRVNLRLGSDGKRLILAIDEYEIIDQKIGERIFPLDLLNTIRESIQMHRRITWIFAGSHEITELRNAAWTSYLVSARTIEVPSFSLAETRLLLTEPLKYSTLWPQESPKRPRFDASYWGENGIERIHAEAGGWPHLVQLIAETTVDLINNEEAGAVTPDLLERALGKAIVRGHNVLYELMNRESTLPGEWAYLAGFRQSDNQSAPADEKIALSLQRRMLVSEENGAWRLRVPLMARWLKVRGQ